MSLAPTPATTDGAPTPDGARLQPFIFALFFIFGGITSLNDVIIPKLKDLFTLSYAQAMLVQSAFFAAYFFVSLPAAALVQRLGYMRSATVGLLVMMAGCLLFMPAAQSGRFVTFLLALFVLASGITIVQVVANPLISLLGRPETAHSRLTFAQAFNSLGTTIFPYFGSILILGALARTDLDTLSAAEAQAYRAAESAVVSQAYVGLAVVLALVALAVWLGRGMLVDRHARGPVLRAFTLLRRPRFAFGTLSIFLYVGAEVAIGSLIVNYLMQPDVMGIAAEAAGRHVPLYWGGALLGRFVGAAFLRLIRPGLVLGGAGTAAILLILVSANVTGSASGWALLAIGLANSIMFPTIFSLASEGLGARTAEGSGVICMAIVGGAVIPPLTGHLGDVAGLRMSLALPAFCYLTLVGFGLFAAGSVRPTWRHLR